jgi:hypothetical protein
MLSSAKCSEFQLTSLHTMTNSILDHCELLRIITNSILRHCERSEAISVRILEHRIILAHPTLIFSEIASSHRSSQCHLFLMQEGEGTSGEMDFILLKKH